MKIVHISISAPFIDSWGYQENLLTKYLQEAGTENYIIASANDFPTYLKQEVIDDIKAKGNRYELDGIKVRRIPTKKVSTSFAITYGLRDMLEEIQPDAIFHHNLNCTSMPISARYARQHGIPMVVDNHADPINLTKNKLWVALYYKGLTRLATWLCKKDIYKAYGVTHSRCDFIHDYYGLTRSNIDFLPIGADVNQAGSIAPKNELRLKYGYWETDFVVVSGGKMGQGKGTDHLIEAVEQLASEYPQLKLVLFGRFEDAQTEQKAKQSAVTTVHGWCDRTKTLELLKMADVACWPIHHTTLIEDAVSVCTPLINRKTGTTEHLIDGNGLWIKDGNKDDLVEAIRLLLTQTDEQRAAVKEACSAMRERVSYRTVAQKLLEDIKQFKTLT